MSAPKLRVLGVVESLVKRAEESVKSLMKPIGGERLRRSGFVDGSFAMDERRGAYLLLLSAASLLVDGDRIEGVVRGSERPLVTLLIPKSHGEARASLLMSTLELLSALDLARRGAEAVFLDGSYLSELLVPIGHAKDVYEDFEGAGGYHDWRRLLDRYGERVARAVEGVAGGDPLRSMSALLEEIATCAGEMHEEMVSQEPDLLGRREAVDFAVVYAETTAYLSALKLLLEECSRAGVAPLWVAKDAEGRYIVKREGVAGWLNDLALLDYAWREGEAVYTVLESDELRVRRPERPCAAWGRLLDEIYSKWAAYGVAYFKLSKLGAVAQMTYPSFVETGTVERALATLLALADRRGYPRPLGYAHHIAVLNPEFARLVADELYRREGDHVVRSVLAPSGRAAAGLR